MTEGATLLLQALTSKKETIVVDLTVRRLDARRLYLRRYNSGRVGSRREGVRRWGGGGQFL